MKTLKAAARRQLDARLEALREIADFPAPHMGWVRAIRQAIGMSTTELAARMGTGQSRISVIEQGEVTGSIKIETLRRAAEALNCDVFYALVPRTTLVEAVRAQGRHKAATHLEHVGHHMRIEDQAVTANAASEELDDLATRMIDRRGLWASESER